MRLFVLIFASVLTAMILSSPNTVANPMPTPESDGVPAPEDSRLDILFKSEKVVYTIDTENVARVVAVYVLQNSANNITSLNISLPFYYNVPKDIMLTSNGQPMPLEVVNLTSFGPSDYSYARFHLDFAACETLTLNATYSLQYAVYYDYLFELLTAPGRVYNQHFWCSYIAETGKYWHNNLDSAEFQFRIKKDLYGSGLDGFQKTEESGYVVATKMYNDWKPDQNIDAKWERPDVGRTVLAHGLLILIIVLIVVLTAVAVIILRRKKKGMPL